MLGSLIPLTALLASAVTTPFTQASPDGTVTAPVNYSLHRPEDPSTLTLALIGAATLAVYFGSRRSVRTRSPAMISESNEPQFTSTAGAELQSIGEVEDEQSRGAA